MNNHTGPLKVKVFTVFLAAFCLFFLMVDKSTNSDYGAYSSMYDGSYVTEGRLYFFGKVMAGVRLVSESFNVFQVFCILAGSYVLWELFHFRSLTNPPSRKLEPLLVVALLLYASLFFVEFYVIRLRAGLSICFFTLSVIALLKHISDTYLYRPQTCVSQSGPIVTAQ